MNFETMKLEELLRYAVESTNGSLAAGCVGMDGITVGVYNTVPNFDTTVADAEFAGMLKLGIKAAANLKIAGDLEELVFTGTNAMLIVRMVGDDFYTGMALKPDGNMGMARLKQKQIVPYLHKILYGQ
jgi:predicted regulator of Ras-like GTPase activity (Roadblock/LC7/MglB family)